MKLSPRQEQVARLVVEGHSAKRIASLLHTYDRKTGERKPLSIRTVQDYIDDIARMIDDGCDGTSNGPGSNRVRITRWWFTRRP